MKVTIPISFEFDLPADQVEALQVEAGKWLNRHADPYGAGAADPAATGIPLIKAISSLYGKLAGSAQLHPGAMPTRLKSFASLAAICCLLQFKACVLEAVLQPWSGPDLQTWRLKIAIVNRDGQECGQFMSTSLPFRQADHDMSLQAYIGAASNAFREAAIAHFAIAAARDPDEDPNPWR
jgi:hypothetical protein